VSHLDNPFRLPRNVLPRRYEIELDPQLSAATFTGIVKIDAEAMTATDEIVMNTKELTIHSVTVNGTPAQFSIHTDTERLVIDSPMTPGPCHIDISFTGILNDKLRGFYRSTFTDESGVEHVIATTQMQSTDCRQAFPCFDEPDMKAVFAVRLIIDPSLMAISNGPEISRDALPDGRVRVSFADTMIMSTYLVAFIVGPLEATDPIDVNGVPMRIVHIPGKAHLTEFGLRVAAYSLEWFQNYYGIPYPSEKVDLIALPDFAAGAMENLGCVTFREVLLLVDPATSTQIEQQLVADVVAHELAHMWFGDLVTMRWWNGIWLNEAFATFMEIAACDAFAPHWQRWTTFGLERSVAFETDSLQSTRAVEFEVNSPNDSEGMFDVLTYQKGGALLRMLEQFLGADRFRAGVSTYLKRHSYGNTETNDLWDAIEDTVSTDGGTHVPVRRLMDSWIWQPGYPLITATQNDSDLVLTQKRFLFDGATDPTLWVIPVHVTIDGVEHKVLLDGLSVQIPLPRADAVVVVNSGGHGFYRVSYDPTLLQRITGPALRERSVLERYNLVDDAWNAVVAGVLPASAFLAFVEGCKDERDLAVWQAIGIGLRGLSRLIEDDALTALRSRIRALVTPALNELTWVVAPAEDELTTKLRGVLIALLAVLGDEESAQQRCREIFIDSSSGNVHPELVAVATSVVASKGSHSDYALFIDRVKNPATPQEQIRMLYALADFDDADLMRQTCEFAFSSEVKTQNAPFVLNRCIANRNHGEIAWSFVRDRWDTANEIFPVNTIVRMVDSVKLLTSDSAATDVPQFFASHPIPQAVKVLEQILERQQINVTMRRRCSTELSSALLATL
jgi:puromycin-sensitive aminopeptidase